MIGNYLVRFGEEYSTPISDWGEDFTLLNIQGIEGSILLMLSHGLVSSALFLCVGALYDRHKTRLVRYYGGLVSTMPNLSTIFLFFTLANMSLPGTSSFIGEFLILLGAYRRNSLVATLAALGMILGAAYSLWLYNRVVFGNPKPKFLHRFSDSDRREVPIFLPFIEGGATVKPPNKCLIKNGFATQHCRCSR